MKHFQKAQQMNQLPHLRDLELTQYRLDHLLPLQNIANNSPDTNNDNIPDTINSFKDRLVVVKEKYYHFIDSYTTVLDIYIGKIIQKII